MCRGGSSAEDWWTMCIPSSLSGVKLVLDLQTMDRIKRWETEIMMRLFRFKSGKDETCVEFQTRCCKAARKIWIQMGLPILYEKLLKACELWDGYVIIGLMQSSIP